MPRGCQATDLDNASRANVVIGVEPLRTPQPIVSAHAAFCAASELARVNHPSRPVANDVDVVAARASRNSVRSPRAGSDRHLDVTLARGRRRAAGTGLRMAPCDEASSRSARWPDQ